MSSDLCTEVEPSRRSSHARYFWAKVLLAGALQPLPPCSAPTCGTVCPDLSLCIVSAGGSCSLSPVLQEGLWHGCLLLLNQSPGQVSLGLEGMRCGKVGIRVLFPVQLCWDRGGQCE